MTTKTWTQALPTSLPVSDYMQEYAAFTLWKYKIDKFSKGRSCDHQSTRKLVLCSHFEPSKLEDLCAHAGPSCPYADLRISVQMITVQSNLPLNHHPVPHMYENPTYITPFYISYIVILAAAFRKSNVHTKREISTRLPSF